MPVTKRTIEYIYQSYEHTLDLYTASWWVFTGLLIHFLKNVTYVHFPLLSCSPSTHKHIHPSARLKRWDGISHSGALGRLLIAREGCVQSELTMPQLFSQTHLMSVLPVPALFSLPSEDDTPSCGPQVNKRWRPSIGRRGDFLGCYLYVCVYACVCVHAFFFKSDQVDRLAFWLSVLDFSVVFGCWKHISIDFRIKSFTTQGLTWISFAAYVWF